MNHVAERTVNPLNPELISICYLLALLAYHFLHVSRLRVKKDLSFLTGAQDSHLQTVTIPEAAYIQLQCRPPEDEQGNARTM